MGRHILWRAIIAKGILIGVCLITIQNSVLAQLDDTQNDDQRQTTLEIHSDWEKGEVVFVLQAPIGRYIAQQNSATAYLANRIWQSNLDQIIPHVLRRIQYGNGQTVLSVAEREGILQSMIEEVASASLLTYNGLSADFHNVEARYTVQLYPTVISYFPEGRRAVGKRYNWIATTDYSGVVIVAQGELPLHNERNNTIVAQPSLLPTIYDEQLRVVLDSAMVEVATKMQHGIVAYDSEYSVEKWQWRVGDNPLIVYARGVQNIRGTNLIISDRDARKMLTREHNRELLKTGKILVILDDVIAIEILTISI